jgi:hypothetical protein
MLRAVSKEAEWGAAVASGWLNGLPLVWASGGSCHWEKDGRPVAAKKIGPLGPVYYLAVDDPTILVRVPA